MRIGIVGGGQLGRMLALAAYPLGLTVVCLDAQADAPAGTVAPLIVGDFTDQQALARLAETSDVITFDFENVPAASAAWLEQHCEVRPGAQALGTAQDRILEKSLFRKLGIPTARFAPVDGVESLPEALAETGLPAVLKTRRLGYDGKGQRVVRTAAEAHRAVTELGGRDLILEELVGFSREVSVIAVRSVDGEILCYPLTENIHRDGILRSSTAPATATAVSASAMELATRLIDALGYVGVLALELFECADGLRANEFAPRVHNSGHWTIEGAVTSQFENHLRAVAGLPLGSTKANSSAAMVNFIGALPERRDVLAIEGCHLHEYGKAGRPGRKVGHATITGPDSHSLESRLAALRSLAENDV